MKRRRFGILGLLLALALVLVAIPAWAHKPSDSYVTVVVDAAHVGVRWDIALRDLDYAVGIDEDGDGSVTWKEARERSPACTAYAIDRLTLVGDGAACPLAAAGEPEVVSHSDGAYLVLHLAADCPAPVKTLAIDYRLLFDVDPQHRGLVRLDGGGTTRTTVLGAEAHHQSFDLADAGGFRAFVTIVAEGVHHIWQGYDHLLFLIALLLPSVVLRDEGRWTPQPRLRGVVADVLRVVSAFTVAHSLTLSLAALGVVSLPSRFVESGIAASVIIAAVNNVVPVLRQDRWVAAFALGLLHGFGFSSTLSDLGLARSHLLQTLFGFNLGVELGQLAVVLTFLPFAFALRATRAYRVVALQGGSIVVAAVASVWLVERAFGVRILAALLPA